MAGRIPLPGLLAAGLAASLAACAPGPRLEASWALVYEPLPIEPYAWVDPDAPSPAAPPARAAKPAGSVYVSIRNLGGRVEIEKILTADGRELQRPERPGGTYILRPGEVLVLPLEGSAACLIPTTLTVEAVYPRRPRRRPATVKVAGKLPASLPDEWIERCNGAIP